MKSNAKKTNRMSPTEFSNYIKQRAMQKQSSIVNAPLASPNGPPAPPTVANILPIGNTSTAAAVNGHFNGRNNYNNSNNGRSPAASIPNGGSYGHHGGGNLNYGGGSGRIQHQPQHDPYFYPLFPDRGQPPQQQQQQQQNGYPGYHGGQQQQQQQQQSMFPSPGSGGSSGSSSSSSTSSNNPWSFGDADADLFLQDILTVGLNSKAVNRANNLFNEYDFGMNSGASSAGSSSSSSNSSLGLGMLNGLGGFGGLNNHGGGMGLNNGLPGGNNSSFFNGLEDLGNVGGKNVGGLVGPASSSTSVTASNNATSNASNGGNQQRVLVAN